MLLVARSHYAHEGDAVNPVLLCLCLALMILFCPSWGALSLLIYVEGAGYMTSPIRIMITLLQVES